MEFVVSEFPFLLEQNNICPSGSFVRAIVDDKTAIGKHDTIVQLVEMEIAHEQDTNSKVNWSKSKVLLHYISSQESYNTIHNEFLQLGFLPENIISHPHNSMDFLNDDNPAVQLAFKLYGAEITGTPIGCDEFVSYWLQNKLIEFEKDVHKIKLIGDNQIIFTILKSSLIHRMTYILRTNEPRLVKLHILPGFERLLKELLAISASVNVQDISDLSWDLACLKLADGGAGIVSLIDIIDSACVFFCQQLKRNSNCQPNYSNCS